MTIQRVAALVSTSWLKQRLAQAGAASKGQLRVLDTSWLPEPHVDGYTEFYKKGHIENSYFFDLKKLSKKRPDSPIDCPIPDSNLFQEYVESFGINNNTHVVAYDSLNSRSSMRTWYLFRLFGHDKVSVLNGGMTQWLKDGNHVTQVEPRPAEKSVFSVNLRSELLKDFKSMMKLVQSQDVQIIDARPAAPGFYTTDDDPSGGHIPGSKNIPFPTLFNEDMTVKSEVELQQLFDAAGVDLTKPVVATCQRGMTACAVALAAHILGKVDVPVYNGSWCEWSAVAPAEYLVKTKQ
ncbi:thiosulfate sulfurtransferase-like [Physella acuta]|uniref:thiosulfate sulfurtransferase-like n=1 Tax=Physella acuta TaxID=109671 RepID=UPI0027DE7262|nr:thiosulfate sulfurtransferase-like [Physella acuta]XP_059147617.1 thiosulfate sulfurtransferase-like [Physella acuta]XP_059147618.1 thiosulfate sulfurtransferase-like [Physella acuta]XP_059147619.1 thiosulfate sulfurtransferase-like [Physella acuta]